MKVPRYYVDTSVIGGCLDEEFEPASSRLMEMARDGDVHLLLSNLLLEELAPAPLEVRAVLAAVPETSIERILVSVESVRLRDAYLTAKVVGPSSMTDAHHVAVATIAGADLIVSWNFKHFVHIDKIRGFQAVNLLNGYNTIDIRSPLEVIS